MSVRRGSRWATRIRWFAPSLQNCSAWRCKYLILKVGERGIISYRSPGSMPREFFTVDSFAEHLVDPVGAGDALLAYASLSLKATGNLVIASILGSVGAAVACEHPGNLPVQVPQVEEKIDRIEKQAQYL